jgi:hypothetical protein
VKFVIRVCNTSLKHEDGVIDLVESEIELIPPVNHYKPEPFDFERYGGKSIHAKYLGQSRIDGFPIFLIDTTQLDREEKISEILK